MESLTTLSGNIPYLLYTFLDQKEAFLYKLVDTLVEQMGDAYPELPAQKELIKKVIKEEEDSFLRTLDNGIRLLDSFIKKSKDAGKENLAGEDAFVLYDTYGFPLDLTELILREQNMGLERDGFDKEMKKQKDRARNAAAVEATDWVEVSQGEEEFVGYDLTETPARILRYRKVFALHVCQAPHVKLHGEDGLPNGWQKWRLGQPCQFVLS